MPSALRGVGCWRGGAAAGSESSQQDGPAGAGLHGETSGAADPGPTRLCVCWLDASGWMRLEHL